MAIKQALGEHAYNIPISSTKSMTGHILGATAAAEAIFAVKAIEDNFVPPTINLENPDPDCDLDYIPLVGRDVQVNHVLSNSFGFGGHNTTVVISRYQ
jgi:3-oxoacyl-[acyl-carrier-protein] synthase II